MGIELQNARMNVEQCAEDIETNIRNDTSCFEDDRTLRKLVRLVGRCHRGERLEMESSGRDVQFGVVQSRPFSARLTDFRWYNAEFLMWLEERWSGKLS